VEHGEAADAGVENGNRKLSLSAGHGANGRRPRGGGAP
jgi:hypothetical protein